ncbi:MAG: MFS transporter [Pseudomonadota bacterium]
MMVSLFAIYRVLLLYLAGIAAASQFAKIAIPFASFQDLYPDAGSEVGWLLSLISLVGAVFGIVAGNLVNRLGARRLLLGGLVLGSGLSLWQASIPAFAPMLISRLLEGGSHLAIVVSAPTLISQLTHPRFMGAAMTLWSTFFGVAFAIVAWIVLPLIGAGSLSALFVGHGVLMLLIAALIVVSVRNPIQSNTTATAARSPILELHRRVYSSVKLSGPGLGWLIYTLTFVSIIAVLPAQLPSDVANLAAGLMPLVSIGVSLFFVPILLRLVSSLLVVALGFALAAAFIVANVALDLQLAFAVGLFAILGLVQGASFAAVPELNESVPDRALSYGCLAQTGNIGNLLGTPLLLFLGRTFGDDASYLAVAGMYVLGAVLLTGVYRATRELVAKRA